MSNELWNLENATDEPVPDDFINAMIFRPLIWKMK
jgi:hypothetical protein